MPMQNPIVAVGRLRPSTGDSLANAASISVSQPRRQLLVHVGVWES